MKRRDFLKLSLLALPIPAIAGIEYEPHIDNEYPIDEHYPWFDHTHSYGTTILTNSPVPPIHELVKSMREVIPPGYRSNIKLMTNKALFNGTYAHAWKYTP